MASKVVKQLNRIGAMKTFTKPNSGLCMEECLTILKNLREKCVMVINNNLEIYRSCWYKTAFCRFCLISDDHVYRMKELGCKMSFKPTV